MHTNLRKLLLTILIALPAMAYAADTQPPVEANTTAPLQVAPGAPAAAPENKPAEPAAAPKGVRIGYVDVVRIGSESERGRALKTLLISRKEALQAKVDAKKKQIEKLKASIESKIATMTPPQREAKSKEFQKKVEEFQKFARSSEEELFSLQEKETKAIFNEIEKAAAAYGKANALAVIVVKKELLYVGSGVDAQDVSEPLIKALNQSSGK